MFLPKDQVYPIFSTECHWISFSNGHPDPPRLQRLLWAVTEGQLKLQPKVPLPLPYTGQRVKTL